MEDLVLNDDSEILDKSKKCYNFSPPVLVGASQYNSRQIVKFTFLHRNAFHSQPFQVPILSPLATQSLCQPDYKTWKKKVYWLGYSYSENENMKEWKSWKENLDPQTNNNLNYSNKSFHLLYLYSITSFSSNFKHVFV